MRLLRDFAGLACAALSMVPVVAAHSAVLNPESPSVKAMLQSGAVKTTALQSAGSIAVPHKTTKSKVATKPKASTLVATIDLARQRMTVAAGSKTLHTWKISSGRRGYSTPSGRFRPAWSAKMWHSRKYDMAPMPYAVFFNHGIATHGTAAISRLGRPASHGCIRLKTSNARSFYRLVHKHGYKRTRIIVTGKTKFRTIPVQVARRRVRQPLYRGRYSSYRNHRFTQFWSYQHRRYTYPYSRHSYITTPARTPQRPSYRQRSYRRNGSFARRRFIYRGNRFYSY